MKSFRDYLEESGYQLNDVDEGWKSKLAGAALAGAAALGGVNAQASDQSGPLPIMATIKFQLPDGSFKTIKKDLGHSYDYRLDDANKDLEKLLKSKGIKNYYIDLNRYRDSDSDKDYLEKTPADAKKTAGDYMQKGPYSSKDSTSSYFDKATGKQFKEAEDKKKKTKEKEADADWSGLDDLFKPKADQPLSTIDSPSRDDGESDEPEQDKRKKASQQDTLRAAGNVTPTDRMRDIMSRMRDIEADDSEYPTPDDTENLPSTRVNTENLPAVAGERLQAAGVQDPKFHQVANLPGNISRSIRTLGKALFGEFTRTPTEDIWMIGNLGGQGPNSNAEVKAVAGYLRDNGEDMGIGDIDFDSTIPGYQADIRQYSAGGIRWLVVMDEFGKYIYSWPERDSVIGQARDQIEQPERDQPRRIGR